MVATVTAAASADAERDTGERLNCPGKDSVWIYELKDPTLRQSVFNRLTGDAGIHPHPTHHTIIGLGSFEQMNMLWEQLRDVSIQVRSKIKKV